MSNILQWFPSGLQPRAVQAYTLREVERCWKSADVIVINLPTGAGKSFIAATIARWAQGAAIVTPTNLLVNQYRADFPDLPGIVGKARYECNNEGGTLFENCKERSDYWTRKKLKGAKHCANCPYLKDQRRVYSGYSRKWPGTYVTNLQLYQVMGLWRSTLIVDEAHNLIPFLQEKHAQLVWRKHWNYPADYQFRPALLEGLKKLQNLEAVLASQAQGTKGIRVLWDELHSASPSYLISAGTELYRGEEAQCLRLAPIDIREMPTILWPSPVKKLILMSATIGPKDVEMLGLSKRRVAYIEAPSPISAERRPVVIEPIGRMSLSARPVLLPKLAAYVREKLAKHPEEKGIIHLPYSWAEDFRQYLGGEERLLWHGKDNVAAVYAEFRESSKPLVMVASGLYEGIDLREDAGRWQVLGKVPWPSLGEAAIRWKAEQDPAWYKWEATKLVLQAAGRICRGPDDYGVTYIPDESILSIIDGTPSWFQESLDVIRGA